MLPNTINDTALIDPDDFIDFSSYINDIDEPIESCPQHPAHGQLIQGDTPLGTCTSCMIPDRVSTSAPSARVPEPQPEASAGPRSVDDDYQTLSHRLSMHSSDGSTSNSAPLESLGEDATESAVNNPKIGSRFSREALRILRNWLLSNHRHPYPNNEEKENLALQTGLNKTQISNWVANARRRGKVRAPRSTSSSPYQHANGIDIPRRTTPTMRDMSPMERWKHSPPEQEPASMAAIATAASSSEFSARNLATNTPDGLAGSMDRLSSTGSSRTSHSSKGSLDSAGSFKSRESLESLSSLRSRGRRRRRRQIPKTVNISGMLGPIYTYQCTFCTETFKTKHDWQRHEKSLHLSLERWVCTPGGPIQTCMESDSPACVYCGLGNPSPEHIEQHNDFVCAEKPSEEKTFYRKDHLRQHLNIVHDAKFQKWSMNTWKVATPKIRSRCGFCGIVMDSWDSRVEHIAQHFKNGKSMADWKGDWGFPEDVLRVVENGMPPYLIHHERNTPNPYEASKEEIIQKKTLEDYVKLWLVDYVNDLTVAGIPLTDDMLLVEAQRIVQKVDTEDSSPTGPDISWFRDLIMLSKPSNNTTQPTVNKGGRENKGSVAWTAQIEKMKASKPFQPGSSTMGCEKEETLMRFVKFKQATGQMPTDCELQFQACKAIEDGEPKANFKCREAVQWFKFLINSSTSWLLEFKCRAGLPNDLENLRDENLRLVDNRATGYGMFHSYYPGKELADPIQAPQVSNKAILRESIENRSLNSPYMDGNAGNQTILYDLGDSSTSEGHNGLTIYHEDILLATLDTSESDSAFHFNDPKASAILLPQTLHWGLPDEAIGCVLPTETSGYPPTFSMGESSNTNPQNQPLRYFLSDANCYGRLEKELTRFVTSCLSPNNPLRHIPSDEEIQHQARWIIYDDDDPWNQTAADNVEWLARFKRDVGLVSADKESGLVPADPPRPWRVKDGGTGFLPPFVKPKEGKHIGFTEFTPVLIDDRPYPVSKDTAESYVRALCSGQYRFPATVFCSRELEDGLNAYVEECMMVLYVPTDDDLRAKGREILGVERTAADDPKLLEAFKAMHVLWGGNVNGVNKLLPEEDPDNNTTEFISGMDMLVLDARQLSSTDLAAEFSAQSGI